MLVLLSVLSFAESTAHARPAGWEYADCNNGEGLICAATTVGVDRWQCETEKTDSSAVRYVAYIVYDPDWDSGDTACEPLCDGEPCCAFGISYDASDTETDRFYCDFDPTDEKEAWLVGNDERDELYFHFPGNPEYNLSDGDGITIGTMFGNGDGDDLHGSKFDGSGYTDFVYGGDGSDYLWMHSGADHGYGGDGDDYIWGGPGVDQLWGDGGNDEICGGEGDDVIGGGAGNDKLSGLGGDDQIMGDAGDDNICGGDDTDELQGNADDDDLHVGYPIDGAESADGGSGGTDYDECYPDSDPTCESSLAFDAPPTCPTESGYSYL